MKVFLKDKRKFLIIGILMVAVVTGCSSPRGQSGKTFINAIYTIKDEKIKKSEIEIPKGNEELEKKYANIGDDELITVPKTTFSNAMNEGWFNGLIVWPITYLINFVAGYSDAGIGILVTTFLIQFLSFLFTIKSQVASQKMQGLQPEMNKITAKYAGKKDQQSKMAQAQEMQALYALHKVNPFGMIFVQVLQFPIIFGMYQATNRAFSVVTGSFQGINLAQSPMEGIKSGLMAPIIIFALMIIFQLLSLKMPQWLQAYRKKKKNIKEKKYAEPKKKPGGMGASMDMVMYMSTGMIAILAINWPLGMSFYWLVGSLARVIQNLVIHKFFIKD